MKRSILFMTAVAGMLAFSACSENKTVVAGQADGDVDNVYTGVLPGADVDGVRYTVILDYDDDGNSGDYEMVQTYFVNDSTGVQDVASFASEGDFTVSQNDAGKKYLKFSAPGADEMFFVVDNDSTITMTDATLVPVNTPGMNYSLKKTK